MLTEDIDLSIRALLRGKKITFDSTIISYDQAPYDIKELWKQRTRWSQGWLQVSWKYALQIWFHNQKKLSFSTIDSTSRGKQSSHWESF
ncbi:glycosyltransferase family 2 protein [Okeania sp. SIO2B3]|uniref:glycosyltransferase n=1 Tax=Okeania sp. SIO2B3 TaxID=2607784 RepID=UPI0013C06D4D|nr:glycosyltransferase family 2 protein [Okeania sp. SIO2B3]NET42360.1 glycosyltransferase family 2 protein [Okeania sp. SIO2B3]